MAGNVVTADMTEVLLMAGADIVKVVALDLYVVTLAQQN